MKAKTSNGTIYTLDGNMVCSMRGDCVTALIRVDKIMDEKALKELGEALETFKSIYCRERKEDDSL